MLQNVAQAFIHYWYFTLALIAASGLTVFVCIKANRAVKRTRREREKIIAGLKYENRLRAEFSHVTQELIDTSEPGRLFDGIAITIQTALEKETDMNAAFENLPQPQKYIYALYYVEHDGADKLSEFFKMNGKPLTQVAKEAVAAVWGCKADDLYTEELNAYDEDEEETSLIKTEIDRIDGKFAALRAEIGTAALAAGYIRENVSVFLALNDDKNTGENS